MKILVIDDEFIHLSLVKKVVEGMGHTVLTAENGRQGWEIWQRDKPRMVITDWIMPEINGLELCKLIRNAGDPLYTYLIIISTQSDQQDIIRGLQGGIDDYLTKPFDVAEFRVRIEIGERIVDLETKLHQKYEAIKENYYQTIRMFTNLTEVFDNDLGGHCRRTAEIAVRLARLIDQVPESEYQTIETAALLHDIGMIGLPPDIITKSRAERTGPETQLYRSHPVLGEIILKEIEFLKPASRLVRLHHEQANGKGFPDGLMAEDIPIGAQIISAASMYDNMTHRGKTPLEEIPDRLYLMRGYQLLPQIVDAMIHFNREAILSELKKNYTEIPIDELQEGMQLAQDVRRTNGALILPAHSVINASGIEKLKKHCEMACVSDKVFIYKNSVRG